MKERDSVEIIPQESLKNDNEPLRLESKTVVKANTLIGQNVTMKIDGVDAIVGRVYGSHPGKNTVYFEILPEFKEMVKEMLGMNPKGISIGFRKS